MEPAAKAGAAISVELDDAQKECIMSWYRFIEFLRIITGRYCIVTVQVERVCKTCGKHFVFSRKCYRRNKKKLRKWIEETVHQCPRCYIKDWSDWEKTFKD